MTFKSLHHSFDIDLAAEYGVHEAILIHHFQHWIRINKKMKRNFHDGKTWSYQTREEMTAHFPYLSEKQIRAITQNLENRNVLIKGNYNKKGFDNTIWYAFVNEDEFLNNPYDCPNGHTSAQTGTPIAQTGNAIPDTIPDTKTSSSSEPTKEEEEEIQRRLKNRPKGSEPIVSFMSWRQTVLEDIRNMVKEEKSLKDEFHKHKQQAQAADGLTINGCFVSACANKVEFSQGSFYKEVEYGISDEEWRILTERWFK